MKNIRLDLLLLQLKKAESRTQAQRMIMAGDVLVNGQRILKSSEFIPPDAVIDVRKPPDYVSRGGEKLSAALKAFSLKDLSGKVCVDVGSSTGGFTDCLLQHGAERVYAVDVGYGILHWKLRNHPSVVVMERTNARYIQAFPEPIQFVTIDASFISLKILLPVCQQWLAPGGGDIVALIKPQFEAGVKDAARGKGVIRDVEVHRKVLLDVLSFVEDEGFDIKGTIRSPVIGPKGNIEFLVHLMFPGSGGLDLKPMIDSLLED